MKVYHVEVIQDEGWFVGRLLDRPGITTQGRSLDELVLMVRDAVSLMWGEKQIHLELALGPSVTAKQTNSAKRRARRDRKLSHV